MATLVSVALGLAIKKVWKKTFNELHITSNTKLQKLSICEYFTCQLCSLVF